MVMSKTIQVVDLINETNRILALTTWSQERKLATAMLLETVLHMTGNYEGFAYNFRWPQPTQFIMVEEYEAALKWAKENEWSRNYLVSKKLRKAA